MPQKPSAKMFTAKSPSDSMIRITKRVAEDIRAFHDVVEVVATSRYWRPEKTGVSPPGRSSLGAQDSLGLRPIG